MMSRSFRRLALTETIQGKGLTRRRRLRDKDNDAGLATAPADKPKIDSGGSAASVEYEDA